MRTKPKYFTLNQRKRIILEGYFAEGKFDLSELRKRNICKQNSKWHVALNVSKSKNMRRYFEANSIIKCDKDKRNKHVIGFD